MASGYIGRFAPSPSGRLHFGSLVAAIASYCDAKSNNGKWLVRIEDVDGSRTVDGASDDILRTLETYGMRWDDNVIWQSQRSNFYSESIEFLKENGLAFDCGCTRKELEGFKIYPGTCRLGLPKGKNPRSIRFKTPKVDINWIDLVLGRQHSKAGSETDFIIKRADGYYAYHLAVVLDDAEAGVTRIVRGEDLLDSTPAHLHLQKAFGLSTPEYAHVRLALNKEGAKLSKANKATPVEQNDAPSQIALALDFLGQKAVDVDSPENMLKQAVSNWEL